MILNFETSRKFHLSNDYFSICLTKVRHIFTSSRVGIYHMFKSTYKALNTLLKVFKNSVVVSVFIVPLVKDIILENALLFKTKTRDETLKLRKKNSMEGIIN